MEDLKSSFEFIDNFDNPVSSVINSSNKDQEIKLDASSINLKHVDSNEHIESQISVSNNDYYFNSNSNNNQDEIEESNDNKEEHIENVPIIQAKQTNQNINLENISLVIQKINDLNLNEHSIYYYIQREKGYYLDLIKGKEMNTIKGKVRSYVVVKVYDNKEDYEYKNEGEDLSERNEGCGNNSGQIECNRRYTHFELFDKFLKDKYPNYIIPFLSEKCAWTLLMEDKDFLEKRRKQLKFYLNYLFSHKTLSQEVEKFITDPFDETYFSDKTQNTFYYPEYEKTKGIIKKKFDKIINSIYIVKEQNNNSNKEMENMEKFYSEFNQSFNKIYEEFAKMKKTIKEKNENNEKIITTLNHYNENNKNNDEDSENNNNSELNNNSDIINLLKNISKININFNDEFNKLYNNIDELYLMINGVVNLFNRYNLFLKKYKEINDFNYDHNIKDIDEELICKEKKDIIKHKNIYENNLKIEIDNFQKCYHDYLFQTIKKFVCFIKDFNGKKYQCYSENSKAFENENKVNMISYKEDNIEKNEENEEENIDD